EEATEGEAVEGQEPHIHTYRYDEAVRDGSRARLATKLVTWINNYESRWLIRHNVRRLLCSVSHFGTCPCVHRRWHLHAGTQPQPSCLPAQQTLHEGRHCT